MCTDTLEDCLVTLSNKDNWHGVIEIGKQFNIQERSKFLWAWPTVDCLWWMKTLLNEHNIETILSIGCGSGLLEWLISRSIGVKVSGLELDKSWWISPYAPQTFVDLKFTEKQITSDFLQMCANTRSDQFALLFCYFNNREAFLQYIRAYDGDFVIIIGPVNEFVVTDPQPLNPKFENDDWYLLSYYQLEDENQNCISFFKRIK